MAVATASSIAEVMYVLHSDIAPKGAHIENELLKLPMHRMKDYRMKYSLFSNLIQGRDHVREVRRTRSSNNKRIDFFVQMKQLTVAVHGAIFYFSRKCLGENPVILFTKRLKVDRHSKPPISLISSKVNCGFFISSISDLILQSAI